MPKPLARGAKKRAPEYAPEPHEEDKASLLPHLHRTRNDSPVAQDYRRDRILLSLSADLEISLGFDCQKINVLHRPVPSTSTIQPDSAGHYAGWNRTAELALTNGFANTHYHSGSFKTGVGKIARMSRTNSRRLLLLPPKVDGEVERPASTVTAGR